MTAPRRLGGSHAALFVAVRLVSALCSAATAFLVGHRLLPDSYGNYSMAIGIAGLVVVAADLGMTSSLARYLAEGRADRRLLWQVLGIKAGAAALCGLLVTLCGVALEHHVLVHRADGPRLGHLLLITGAFIVLQVGSAFLGGVLPTIRRFRAMIVVTFVQPAVQLVGTVLALHMGYGAGGALVAAVAGALAVVLLGALVLIPFRPGAGEDGQRGKEIVDLGTLARYSSSLLLVWISFAIFGYVDQIVIWIDHGAVTSAPYQLSWQLIAFMALPGLSIAQLAAPRVAARGRMAVDGFQRWMSLLTVGYVGVVAICDVLAPQIFTIINHRYRHSWYTLDSLTAYALLLGVAPLASMAVNFLGGAPRRVRLTVLSVSLNIVLDLALVPSLGVWGAAIGTTVSYTWYTLGHVRLAYRLLDTHVPVRRTLTAAPRVLAAAAAGAAASWGIAHAIGQPLIGLLVAGPVGFVLFAMIAWGGRRALPAASSDLGPDDRAVVLHVADFAASYPGAFIRQLRMLDDELVERGAGRCAIGVPERVGDAAWIAEVRASGIPVLRLPQVAGSRPFATAPQIAAAAQQLGATVVHSHFGEYDLACARAVKLVRRLEHRPLSLVWHYRTALSVPPSERRLVQRVKDWIKYTLVGRRVDLCVSVTEGLAREVVERGFAADRSLAITAGCDVDSFRPDADARRQVRAELGVADDELLLLHLGWDWHRKGGDLLATADALLRERGVRLVSASVGMPAGVTDGGAVRALPFTDRVWELHQAADVFVSASRSEGFGNGLVEAMASGVVAVAALADGQREIFDDVGPGVVAVPVDDAEAIADAVQALLAEREHWHAWGTANRAHIVAHYSMRSWARRMAQAYAARVTDIVPADTDIADSDDDRRVA